MSLLVINSSSRIAGGVIKSLTKNSAFSKIVCADLYPNYHGINRFLQLKDSIGTGKTETKVTDLKIQGKSSLENAINQADQVVYITHDYYALVPSKLNLIKTVAGLAGKQNTPLLCVTPSEYDHFGEKDPIQAALHSEKDALEANPDATLIRTDLTFGADSQVIGQTLFNRIANGTSLYLATPTSVSYNYFHFGIFASFVPFLD